MIGNWELKGLNEADLQYVLAEANADAACQLSQDMHDGKYQSTWSHAKVLLSLVHHSVEMFLKYALARAGQSVPNHHYIRELHQKYLTVYAGQQFAFEPPFIKHFMGLSPNEVREELQEEQGDKNQTDQMLRYHTDGKGSPWVSTHGFLPSEFLSDTTMLLYRMKELREQIEKIADNQ